MVASLTALPVIGVPIKTKSLDGLDSLLSIAQMPPGVPVATMAINGARNAGILACQILGTKYSDIASRVEKYKRELDRSVLKKVRMLEKSGVGRYKGTFRVNFICDCQLYRALNDRTSHFAETKIHKEQ